MNSPVEKSEIPIDAELLEKLSHPLRQQILTLMERERRIGYKALKEECKVSTGTLYHHLKILKGLIEQDNQKKYLLTEEGEKAVAYLYQDTQYYNPPSLNISVAHSVSESEPEIKTPKSIIYSLFHLPRWLYSGIIVWYLILTLFIMFIDLKMVFFHFIPLEISNLNQLWWKLVPVVWLLVTIFCLVIVSWVSGQRVSLAAWAWLIVYHTIIEAVILLLYLLPGLGSRFVLQFLSFSLQAIFLLFFTLILIYDFCTWERALLIGLSLNYLVLLLFSV